MQRNGSRPKALISRLAVVVGSIALVLGITGGTALAETPVQSDAGWQRIITAGGVGGGTIAGPYNFTTTAALTKITVLDAFCHGDEFHVMDNGTLLGDTSHIAPEDQTCPFILYIPEVPNRPDAALADLTFSRGVFYVAPGQHSLEITNKAMWIGASEFTEGTGAYFRLDTVDLTGNVSVQLTDAHGGLLNGGTVSYYKNGWHTLGTIGSNGTITADLPDGSYSFAMTYNGTRQQLNNVEVTGSSTNVAFHTSDVAVQLVDSQGRPLESGAASYYANGWRTIGATDSDGSATVQMLPGSYSFAMTFNGTRQQLNGQPVSGSDSTVAFQTGQVHSASAAATGYYAAGWRTFHQDMQLLPGTYTFSFSDVTPNTPLTLTGGVVNTIH